MAFDVLKSEEYFNYNMNDVNNLISNSDLMTDLTISIHGDLGIDGSSDDILNYFADAVDKGLIFKRHNRMLHLIIDDYGIINFSPIGTNTLRMEIHNSITNNNKITIVSEE